MSGNFRYCYAADFLKFWLMPFVCILCFGFPTAYGGFISTLCGFAPLCFYILCGFFTLIDEEDVPEEIQEDIQRRLLLKGMKRSGTLFALLLAVYTLVNVSYFVLNGAGVSELLSKRILFNFFVLSAWPFSMGQSISFIQCLFYAYVILFVLQRLGLLRFYKVLLLLCLVLTLITGEFAGVLNFRFLGAPYLPPNVITCALPYMLIGKLIREKTEVLFRHSSAAWLSLILPGVLLAVLELTLLSRMGLLRTADHVVGFGVMAVGICCCALSSPEMPPSWFSFHGRRFARIIYAICQVVAFVLIVPAGELAPNLVPYIQQAGGLAVYVICLVTAILYDLVIPKKYRAAGDIPGDEKPETLVSEEEESL